MANEITTYRGNTTVLSVTIPAEFSGYTADFSVNLKEYGEDSLVFIITGITITNNVATVTITATQNDIDERVYWYQCDINYDTIKYTAVKSTYTVLPSLT